MKPSEAFGSVMKKWRLARELSQVQLAKECDLDRTFISLLETGKRQPTLTTILALSEALKVKPEELVRQTHRKMSGARRVSADRSRRL